MELKRQHDADEPEPEESLAPQAEVTELRSHLVKARLRVAVENLETAERLLRARGVEAEASHDDARKLIDSARRELETLKALVRGDDGGVV